ncbi:MAG: serine protease [Gemmatimonadetes bacterium]|nr:MAG: serine protease [Gemmatimonadota bacterium]
MNYHLGLLVLFVVLSGCSQRMYDVAYPTLSDGKYDSEFPYRNASSQLAAVSETIKMVNVIAYYKTYRFAVSDGIQREDLTRALAEEKAISTDYFNETASGTATVIDREGRRVAVLTCAHTVNFPDTVISLFPHSSQTIQSVAFKEKQINYIRDLPEGGDLDILAMDPAIDVAVLGQTFSVPVEGFLPVFHYPLGQGKALEWGAFVYVIGYPMGYQMITKGIVSSPNRDGQGSFLIDAPFNRGFSGGVVLAIRDGVPNFELVGMAKSVAADYENIIIPEPQSSGQRYDPHLPYTGDLFVKSNVVIKYGITHVISAELIQNFFARYQADLEQKGFYFRHLQPPN